MNEMKSKRRWSVVVLALGGIASQNFQQADARLEEPGRTVRGSGPPFAPAGGS